MSAEVRIMTPHLIRRELNDLARRAGCSCRVAMIEDVKAGLYAGTILESKVNALLFLLGDD